MDDQTLHHFMEDLMPIVVLPVMFVAMAWVLGAIIGAFRHRMQLKSQSDFHNKLMEKFGSAQEFTTYLQTEAGRDFFERLTVEPAKPLAGILNSIKFGIILTLLGVGVFSTNGIIGTNDSRNIMLIVSVVFFAAGVGFLISSAISYRLSKSWGLITVGKPMSHKEDLKTPAASI